MTDVGRYDVAVLGLGAMGSAALYHLARHGARVCGIEQFGAVHDRGSSHGEARVIRKAYFEHPDYVPLLERAYDLWDELEQETGAPLRVENGLLLSSPPGSEAVEGLERCYRAHTLPHERLSSAEATARYPVFRLPEDHVCFFDPQGGYLRAEACIRACLDGAQRLGAAAHFEEGPALWESAGEGYRLTTKKRTIEADRLVITAGAWASRVLAELGLPLTVLRKVQLWYDTPRRDGFAPEAFPTYFVDTDYGAFYGFPVLGSAGIKVAEHSGGAPADGPEALDRDLHSEDEGPIRRFLDETFPGLEPVRTRHSVCMYTMTPDAHFVIDEHPDRPGLYFAAGFSGHGFKFASVIGEILAHLALDGRTAHPIAFLRAARLAPGADR